MDIVASLIGGEMRKRSQRIGGKTASVLMMICLMQIPRMMIVI